MIRVTIMVMPGDGDNPGVDPMDRYSRQILFEPIGRKGQQRLRQSRVVLIGCGGLGTPLAEMLVRAGIGHLRIADRDFIELSNLQRQVLFDMNDVADNLPKAEAARRKLERINPEVVVEAQVTDVNARNIEAIAADADLILDGTDNFETRFLINDLAVKTARPWIYGACAAATGLALVILPQDGPCLRCLFEKAPPPELNPTCDTVGILGPVAIAVAAHQGLEAIKILTGNIDEVDRRLLSFDAWAGRFRRIDVHKAYDNEDCPCCKAGRFEYLEGQIASSAVVLCGRDAVQIQAPEPGEIDLGAMARRLAPVAGREPVVNAYLLKVELEGCEMTLFADGRAVIKGAETPEQARTIYARYVGT